MSPAELVDAAAKAALDDAKGDLSGAAKMMEQAVRASSSLRTAVTDPLIAQACYDAVRRQIKWARREAWTGTKHRGSQSTPEVIQAQQSRVVHLAAGTLAMFPLPGGKRLGEATREEIVAAADFYGRQASDMGAKARWLRLIGQSLPDGKRVSDVLTDKRLRELQAEAQSDGN